MSAVTIELPELLHSKLREFADASGSSLERLLTSAAAEKLSALMEGDSYLQREASQASREAFERVLAKAPDVEPEDDDKVS